MPNTSFPRTRHLPLAILLSTLLVAMPACAQDQSAQCKNSDGTELTISASSDVKAAPDVAMITAGILSVAPNVAAAMKENTTQMNAMFAAVKEAGIAEKDMQTNGFSIQPQYMYAENQAPRITGYQVSNNLTIKIRDMTKIGTMLDTLATRGANQVSGPDFTIDNPDALMDKARAEAVAKARSRAEIYAQAADLKIKRITAISEQMMAPPMPVYKAARMEMAADAMGAGPAPIAAGEVGMSVTVNVGFELE
ncbi:MAG: SIMPL domain-containing protein [Pseudomonadota bacterium]